jgi:hypothetical protein
MKPFELIKLDFEPMENQTSDEDRDDRLKSETTISFECADLCGLDLYIGTSDGFLYHFFVRTTHNLILQRRVKVSNHQISQIVTVPFHQKLLILASIPSLTRFHSVYL